MWHLKNHTNELLHKTERDPYNQKQTHGYQKGNVVGKDKLGAWD